MPKFLFLYRSAPPTKMPSPEEMQVVLKNWMDWIGKYVASGQMVDGGDGLQHTGKVVKNGVVSDGPFMEAKEIIGGYSIVSIENYDQAAAIALECPANHEGGSVEIRELAGY